MLEIQVLYRDEDVLAVDKPVGLLTHSDGASAEGADVVTRLRRQLGIEYLGIHQRLDRDVSGVLVFAARKQANAGLARAFEGRTVRKEYAAVVHGHPPASVGRIEAAMVSAGSGRWRVAGDSDRSVKPASTSYKIQAESEQLTWLWVRIESGRTHQIRVHLAHLGCPIVGDREYGIPDAAPRLMLHAFRLELEHPLTGQHLRIDAPVPEALTEGLLEAPAPVALTEAPIKAPEPLLEGLRDKKEEPR